MSHRINQSVLVGGLQIPNERGRGSGQVDGREDDPRDRREGDVQRAQGKGCGMKKW